MMCLCQRIVVSTAGDEILSAMSRKNQQKSKLMIYNCVNIQVTSWGHAVLVRLYFSNL